MEKNDIASLLDALSERPLAGEGEALSPELEAFYRRAAEVVAREGELPPDWAADPDKLPALLAALHDGGGSEAERDAFVQAAADSAALRLDSESALAFLDGLDGTLEPAPAHLLAGLETAAASEPAPMPRIWSLASIFAMHRTSWRLAGAFAVLLVAGGLSWTLYGPSGQSVETAQSKPPVAAAVKAAASKVVSPVVADKPAALAESCPPAATAQSAQTNKVTAAREGAAPVAAPSGVGCNSDANRQLADKTEELTRQLDAMRHAEAASRKAAAAAAAMPADRFGPAGMVGAARPAARYGTGDAAMPASPSPYGYNASPYGAPPAAAMRPGAFPR